MTRYQVQPRGKNIRGTFSIFPVEGCHLDGDLGRLNLATELGQVKARTSSEAVKIARERGIGLNCQIWAIESLSDDRVTVIEE